MSRYKLHRRIPGWIERGLGEGSLVKGPGGVIRCRSGINKDAVVAIVRLPPTNGSPLHARQHGQTSAARSDGARAWALDSRPPDLVVQQQTSFVDAASQVAGIVDLYVSELGSGSIAAVDVIGDMLFGFALARIDGHLQLVERAVSNTLDMVRHSLRALRDVGDLQVVGFTVQVERGVELLQRGLDSGDRAYFARAAERLEEGFADIRTVLRTMSGEQMLENASQIRQLLRAAALCATGEMQAMLLADKGLETRIASLKAHQSFWKEVRDRLQEIPGPATRLPTLAMLRTEKERGLMNTRRKWMEQVQQMLETLQGEEAFLQALQTIPESELGAMTSGDADGAGAVLCLVNREAVPEGLSRSPGRG